MVTTVEAYKEFTLYLRVPLPQDDTNHNKKMVGSSIIEINHAKLVDSHLQATESIVGGMTITGGSPSPVKPIAALNVDEDVENAVKLRPSPTVLQKTTLLRVASL